MYMYHITQRERIDKLFSFLKNQPKDKGIAVYYDDDTDGVTSGVITLKTLEKLGFESVYAYPKTKENPLFTEQFLRQLNEYNIDTILCVDFDPYSWKFLDEKRLTKLPFNLIVIDHHTNYQSAYDECQSSLLRLFIHPFNATNATDPGQYCCAKFTFDIFCTIADLKDEEWKVITGMIGDMNIIKWNSFIREKAILFDNPIPDEDVSFFTSIYGRISAVIYFASSKDNQEIQKVFEKYLHATKPEHMLQLESHFKKEKEFYEKILKDWSEFSQFDEKNNIYIVHLPSGFHLTSLVSSIISYIHSSKTFIFYQDNSEGMYHISARSQKTPYHLGKVMTYITKGLNGAHGGGHKQAAGGICKTDDFETLIERFKNNLEYFRE